MNTKSTLLCAMLTLCLNNIKAQVNVQDSLTLVDLYNSTNGASWKDHTNWLTNKRVSSWFGITVRTERVIEISLYDNNLVGVLPSSIGNLVKLDTLLLFFNKLTGGIPSSIGILQICKVCFCFPIT
jgi:hypothetical protein